MRFQNMVETIINAIIKLVTQLLNLKSLNYLASKKIYKKAILFLFHSISEKLLFINFKSNTHD